MGEWPWMPIRMRGRRYWSVHRPRWWARRRRRAAMGLRFDFSSYPITLSQELLRTAMRGPTR